jgi:hypothetical protein
MFPSYQHKLRSAIPFWTSWRSAPYDASELNKDAVACRLDDAAMMQSDGRINQIAPERPQPRERVLLVGAGELATSATRNGCELSGLRHGCPSPHARIACLLISLDSLFSWVVIAPQLETVQYFSHPSAAADAGDYHVDHSEGRVEVAAGLQFRAISAILSRLLGQLESAQPWFKKVPEL